MEIFNIRHLQNIKSLIFNVGAEMMDLSYLNILDISETLSPRGISTTTRIRYGDD